MYETSINLMGISIEIRYQIHEEGYIEWEISNGPYADEQHCAVMELLDTVLRVTHIPYIESTIREHNHWRCEEEARAYPPDEVF